MTLRGDRPGRRVQLHRAVSKLGWGSRGQAWAWIRAGEVRVDDRVVTEPLTWVDLDRQRITRHEQSAPASAGPLTLALHKPRGVVTTRRDERGRQTVYDLLPPGLPWIFPAGRLDADSEGLLILTSDAALAMRLTEPEHHVAKTYHVTVSGRPTADVLDRLRRGVDLARWPHAPRSRAAAPGGREEQRGRNRFDRGAQSPGSPHGRRRGSSRAPAGARGDRRVSAGRLAAGSASDPGRSGSGTVARLVRA